jgi:hypothetical protein
MTHTHILRGLSPQGNYTERVTAALTAKLVSTFADRGVAWSRFSVPELLLLLLSSSSIVLTRLSGPRSRPTTFQKIW